MSTEFKYAGTVSHGTLRFQDVFSAVKKCLKEIDKNESFKYLLYEPEDDFTLESMYDALNELCPDNYYFGAHPGDGSDIGFWEVEEDDIKY